MLETEMNFHYIDMAIKKLHMSLKVAHLCELNRLNHVSPEMISARGGTLFAEAYESYLKMCEDDLNNRGISLLKEIFGKVYRVGDTDLLIESVIFNEPATIVKWSDGTKTVVKCGEYDTFDKEKGLAMAIIKKLYDNSSNFNELFRKFDCYGPIEPESETEAEPEKESEPKPETKKKRGRPR